MMTEAQKQHAERLVAQAADPEFARSKVQHELNRFRQALGFEDYEGLRERILHNLDRRPQPRRLA